MADSVSSLLVTRRALYRLRYALGRACSGVIVCSVLCVIICLVCMRIELGRALRLVVDRAALWRI